MKAMCTSCYSPQIVEMESWEELGMFSCAKCGGKLKKCSENKFDDYYRSGEAERRGTTGIMKAKKEPK